MSVAALFDAVRDAEYDGHSGYDGVADPNDGLWRKSLLLQRDIAREGESAIPGLLKGLDDPSYQVRVLSTKFLGIHRSPDATDRLIEALQKAEEIRGHRALVACESAIALGRIGGAKAKSALQAAESDSAEKDVQNRAGVGLTLLDGRRDDTGEILAAYAALDANDFRMLETGKPAPHFELRDVEDETHQLSDLSGNVSLLIWIFAEWCPVCHGEFHELESMEAQFRDNNINVFTIQVGDRDRCSVMAQMHAPWWPHLYDTAGAVSARYRTDPFEFTVHAEWINRPATIIINRDGRVDFAYYGTFYGDRPSVAQTFEMIERERYEFEHPDRRK